MSDVLRVLIVEDLPTDAGLNEHEVRQVLPTSEFQCVETQENFLAALESFRPGIILSDYKLPAFDGITALKLSQEHAPEIPFIIITGSINEDTAVKCMKAGAWDYVLKEHIKRLGPAVLSALEQKRLRIEQKQAAQNLLESEERFRRIYEKSPVAYHSLSPEGCILDVNPAWQNLFGYACEEAIGRRLDEFFTTASKADFSERFQRFQESGSTHGSEYEVRCKNGKILTISIDAVFVRDAQGNPAYTHSVLHNITELKRSEKALQAKNDELIHFNYTVSHDLKSPLVTIKTFIGYLEQDMAQADQEHIEQDMGYIKTATDKMNALLEELIALSRIGRMVNMPSEAPLQQIVQEALELVAGHIAKRGVRVQVTEKPVLLYGDRVRLLTVFQSLIENAVKFMGKQPEPLIEIGAETKNSEIVCFVRENGMGIDPRHKDKLFGLFEKLHPEIEGTGMGLALVKRIVELHGGRIWAESEGLGKGACFWFSLPCKLVQG